MKWFVYMLLLKNNTLYTGITNDVLRRMKTHLKGKGSKYVKAHTPFTLVYAETAKNRSAASKREYAIKQLSREQKNKLLELPSNICNRIPLENLIFK